MRVPYSSLILAGSVDALAAKVESLMLEVAGAKGQGTFLLLNLIVYGLPPSTTLVMCNCFASLVR